MWAAAQGDWDLTAIAVDLAMRTNPDPCRFCRFRRSELYNQRRGALHDHRAPRQDGRDRTRAPANESCNQSSSELVLQLACGSR